MWYNPQRIDLFEPAEGICLVLAKLLLLFIIVPLVELTLLLIFAHVTGHWIYSLGLVLITGTIGALLARMQGMVALRRIRQELAQGRMPADSLLDGLLILVAGIFLLTPGILTDLAGVALLVPAGRRRCKTWLINRFKARFARWQFTGQAFSRTDAGSPFDPRTVDSHVIDSHAVDSHAVDSHAVDSHAVDSHGGDPPEGDGQPVDQATGDVKRAATDDRPS